MRTVQQLYDDKRDKVIIDIRDKEEYDKETMDSAVQVLQAQLHYHLT